jgi:general secretion pathway protein H
MRRLVTGMTINRGFTLIEILIVIVIIGITVGFAMIAFGDFGASRRILFSAEQLVNTLHLAQQQAILETSTLGLRIDNNSYQILRFENSSSWEPISNKGVFKVNYFPQHTVITLKTNTKPLQGSPSIIINSSGNMTPFTLSFGTSKETALTVVTGSHDGSLNFATVNPK